MLRALCPFHGSDRQRSLRVQVTAAALSALPVVPGAIWRRRVRSGARSSNARQPCSGLQPTGSACHTAASRHRGFPDGQWQQPGNARQIPQHRMHLLQLAPTWPSSSPPSRRLCQGAAATRTCSSAAFPWSWRSSWVWAMRRQAPGPIPHGIGVVAVWSFLIRRRMEAWSTSTGVLLALQRRFPRPSGRNICLAQRATATPLVCHRRPPPAVAFTSSCPGRVRVPWHAAAR